MRRSWLKTRRSNCFPPSPPSEVDLGLHRAAGSEIIARAKRELRTVITADLDYPRLLAVARASEPSVILFRNGDWTEDQVRKRLAQILAGVTEHDIAQSIIVVDRVRRRRLPIG